MIRRRLPPPLELLRTSEARFADLPDWPYAPRYQEVGDEALRIHYVDEGPRDGDVVLLLHGEPTWSYLYRKMIPVLVAHGLRVVAPDLPGFGRSDKPRRVADFTYARLVGWMLQWLTALDLREITLVGQDWGALTGLRLLAEEPRRFARVVIANGGLPTGDHATAPAFHLWRSFVRWSPVLPVGRIVTLGCARGLDRRARAAYEAPFPGRRYLAGPRALPGLVPVSPRDPAAPDQRRAWDVLKRWGKPFLCAFGDKDPMTRGADRVFCKLVPGTQGQPHTTIQGAGHFLQEDRGPELAELIAGFVATTGAPR